MLHVLLVSRTQFLLLLSARCEPLLVFLVALPGIPTCGMGNLTLVFDFNVTSFVTFIVAEASPP